MWDTESEARGHVHAGATSLEYTFSSSGIDKLRLAHLPFYLSQARRSGGLGGVGVVGWE